MYRTLVIIRKISPDRANHSDPAYYTATSKTKKITSHVFLQFIYYQHS